MKHIHHINGDTTDNRPENLRVVDSRSTDEILRDFQEERDGDVRVARAHMKFLEAHPDMSATYGSGILTRRIMAGLFEHFRFAGDLPNKLEPE